MSQAFERLAKTPNISARSKPWWNNSCNEALTELRRDRSRQSRRNFRAVVRQAQRSHYDAQIKDAVQRRRPWDLTSWYKPRHLQTTTAINDADGKPMISVEELTRGCQGQFFKAADRPVDPTILDEVPAHDTREWCAFSRHEVHEQLVKQPGNSAPGLDHVSWRALKYAARDPDVLDSLATFYTALLDQGVWPRAFKTNTCIVLSKPNKPDYTKLKAYRPIVLIYVKAPTI